MEAIINKYGFKEGLSTKEGKIIDWPYSKPQPTQTELNSLISIYEAKSKKQAEINAQRNINTAVDECYTIDNIRYLFQKDIVSQLNFANTVISGTDIAVYGWITSDNQIIDISKDDLIGICAHIRDTNSGEFLQARKRKDAVLAILPADDKTVAECIEEVNGFDITKTIT